MKHGYLVFFFFAQVGFINAFEQNYRYSSESTELRKADRTIEVNCNIFPNISLGTA